MEKYKVFRVMRKTGNRKTLVKGLSMEQAQKMVQSFPNSDKSMVCFTKQ